MVLQKKKFMKKTISILDSWSRKTYSIYNSSRDRKKKEKNHEVLLWFLHLAPKVTL